MENDKHLAEVRKLNAEAAKAEAEAAKLAAEADATCKEGDANAKRLQAEAARLETEKESLLLELAQEQIKLNLAEMDLKNKTQEQLEKEAKNEYHNIYYFRSDVDSSSVGDCIKTFDTWRRVGNARGLESKDIPISIIFSSPGGSVIDGLRLFDYLQECRRAGHSVSTGTYGYAASMAGILLQAGDVRWIGKESWVLIHQISAFTGGKLPEMEDTTKFLKRIQDRVINIFASRAIEIDGAGPIQVETKVEEGQQAYGGTYGHPWVDLGECRRFMKYHWERKDWWLSSDDCLALGFVDEVR